MAVTREDVKHVAALARLGLTDDRADQFTAQINTILRHMEVLSEVNTDRLEPVVGVGAESAPLQEDKGPAVPLETPIEKFAPQVRDGLFLVPRLSTHETAEES
jgi:aspartyl-tRNA(Asn)/glutamyl-tRNA(Gln) amidotransferase subunit C